MTPYILTELVIDTPVPGTQEGDEIVPGESTLTIKRSGVVIATRNIIQRRPVTAGLVPSDRLLTSVFVVERNPMASGVMATLTGARIEEGTGKYFYSFSNGSEREYPDRQSVVDVAAALDTDADKAMDVLIAMSVRNDDNGGNVGVMVGRSCTIDMAATQPFSISQGEG